MKNNIFVLGFLFIFLWFTGLAEGSLSLTVKVSDDYKLVNQNQTLLVKVDLKNDVDEILNGKIKYNILDSKGKLINTEEDDIILENVLEINKWLSSPSVPGSYKIKTIIETGDTQKEAEDTFRVIKQKEEQFDTTTFVLALIAFLVVTGIVFGVIIKLRSKKELP